MEFVFADVKEEMTRSWSKVFKDLPEITVYRGSILDVACDAVVSPANSFGYMDGGIDMIYSQHFGWGVQESLQQLIREKYQGELLVGMADIVETKNDEIPFVIAAPTMRVPMMLQESVNPYLAMRAVILLVKNGIFSRGMKAGEAIKNHVRRIAVPGFGTGVGRVSTDTCARQQYKAMKDFVYADYRFPKGWYEASERHQLLYTDKPRDLQYPK
jgi:O-acetyl-ADP-ribose deacetylase (regulator of RNase III)